MEPAYIYSGENHDWDLVLRASNVMLQTGEHFRQNNEISFSAFLSAMLLAHTSIESFTASMAFKLNQRDAASLNYRKFVAQRGFWTKVNMVCKAADIDSQAEEPPFDAIRVMLEWRNTLVHSLPSRVDDTPIAYTAEVHQLHASFHDLEFSRKVNGDNARRFFDAANGYVSLLEAKTGIEPRSFASYAPVAP